MWLLIAALAASFILSGTAMPATVMAAHVSETPQPATTAPDTTTDLPYVYFGGLGVLVLTAVTLAVRRPRD